MGRIIDVGHGDAHRSRISAQGGMAGAPLGMKQCWVRAISRGFALALLAVCTGELCAQQSWPARPVRLIVANSPGAPTDVAGRVFADAMSKYFGRPWVLENRPGGDGLVAGETVARAEADGYTLFFASQNTLAIDPHTRKSMPFDPVRDFTPIAVAMDRPGGWAIFSNAALPFQTFSGMVGYAKANPGKLTFSTTVPLYAMAVEWLKRKGGLDIVEVPYKSTGQALQDTVSGVVSVGVGAFPVFEPHVQAGKLRVLAVNSMNRLEDRKDVPTISETYPGFYMSSWVVLVGPAGLPNSIVQRINEAASTVVREPAFVEGFRKIGWTNVEGARTPQATAEFIRTERERWGRIVREVGLTPQ